MDEQESARAHIDEAEVCEHNARAARILGDERAAERLDKSADYHRMRARELSK